MDPFLPGEIPVMVLRYLTANQCTGTAMKLIEEMPRMKDYIPAKPAQMSDTVYLKHLLRSSVNPGLKDVLWDYGNSKILIEEMLDTEEGLDTFPSSTSESLASKIKTVQAKLNTAEPKVNPSTSSISPVQNEVFKKPQAVDKVEIGTNTDKYECPECVARSANQPPPTTDSGCQTEEYNDVQLELREEIPILFYNTLLNDNNLQEKIVQTINEHIVDPQEKSGVVQKISSKAETEIDKFLVELLQDMPDDNSNSDIGLVQNLSGPTTFADIERNLSSMFGEPDNLLSNNVPALPTTESSNPVPSEKLSQSLDSNLLQQRASSEETPNLTMISTPSPCTSSNEACDTSPEQSRNPVKLSDFIAPPGATATPKRSHRHQSVKRITPTPLTSAHINPVFNTSVVVEKQKIDMGEKSATMSVITTNIETPNWQKLSRRSITPKIPGLLSPKITHNLTVLNQERREVFKLGDDASKNTIVDLPSRTENSGRLSSGNQREESQSSTKKRKATPVKLTPEKAKNSDYNFMHVYHEANKPLSSAKSVDPKSSAKMTGSVNKNITSAVKKTPVPSTSSAPNQNKIPTASNELAFSENSQNDVTPMQPPPPVDALSTSTLKTISPNALQRLIASANKISTTTTTAANFVNKKKSFSTPRKRKHVRNLTFATPPSLKAIAPGSVPCRGGSATTHKRKADEDCFVAELRSKKRLNWPDSDKKKKTAYADSSVGTQTPASAFNKSIDVMGEKKKESPEPATSTAKVTSKAVSYSKLSMPTIAEESMSNLSIAADDSNAQKITIHSDTSVPAARQQQASVPLSGPVTSESIKSLSLMQIPVTLSDGTVQQQFFHVSEDMQILTPIAFYPMEQTEGVPDPLGQTLGIQVLQPPVSVHPSTSTPQEISLYPLGLPKLDNASQSVLPSLDPSSLQEPVPLSLTAPSSSNAEARSSRSTLPSIAYPSSQVQTTGSLEAPVATPTPVSPTASFVATVSLSKSQNVDTTPPALKTVQPVKHKNSSHSKDLQSSCSTETTTTRDKDKLSHHTSKRFKHPEPEEVPIPDLPQTKPLSMMTRSRDESKRASLSNSHDKQELLKEEQKNKANEHNREARTRSKEKRGSEKDREKEEKDRKKAKGKGKQSEAQKKPKLMLNVRDLFGESPVKKKLSKSKLPVDVVAAQAVAADAVPLGSPRRSPRKTAMKEQQRSFEKTPSQKGRKRNHSAVDKDVEQNAEPCVPEKDSQVESQPGMLQMQTNGPPHNESVVFNIVPAPLGFPDPTPIKNFAETGCLNISEITCDMNGPLITPFKSVPPPGLNETHFTLPPTPRVMLEDTDSNSNSVQLMFDSLYPTHLLTSTPMKAGVPRTPGKGSSSSNSQSPIQAGKSAGGAVQVQHVPQQHNPHTVQGAQVAAPTQTKSNEGIATTSSRNDIETDNSAAATALLNLSSPTDKSKSDGEISSSDDTQDSDKAKTLDRQDSVPQKSQSPVKFHHPTTRGHQHPFKNPHQLRSSDLQRHDHRLSPTKNLQRPKTQSDHQPQLHDFHHSQHRCEVPPNNQQLQTHGQQQARANDFHQPQTQGRRQPPKKDFQQHHPHSHYQQTNDLHSQTDDRRKIPPKDIEYHQSQGHQQPQIHEPQTRSHQEPQVHEPQTRRHQEPQVLEPQTRSHQAPQIHEPQTRSHQQPHETQTRSQQQPHETQTRSQQQPHETQTRSHQQPHETQTRSHQQPHETQTRSHQQPHETHTRSHQQPHETHTRSHQQPHEIQTRSHQQPHEPQCRGHQQPHEPQCRSHQQPHEPQSRGHQQPHEPQSRSHQQSQIHEPQTRSHQHETRTRSHQEPQVHEPQTRGHQHETRTRSHQEPQVHEPQTRSHQQRQIHQPQTRGHQQPPLHETQTRSHQQPPLHEPQTRGHSSQYSDRPQTHGRHQLPPNDLQERHTRGRDHRKAQAYQGQRHSHSEPDLPDHRQPRNQGRHHSQPEIRQSQRNVHPEPETQKDHQSQPEDHSQRQAHNNVYNRSQVVPSSSELPSQNGNHSAPHNSNSRPPPLQPLPHISVSLNPNLKQTHGINFHVGGREKLLTISEKETLYSLINMGAVARVRSDDEARKENPLIPVQIKPSVPVVTASQKPNEGNDDASQLSAHAVLKNKTLDHLLKAVRRKKESASKTT